MHVKIDKPDKPGWYWYAESDGSGGTFDPVPVRLRMISGSLEKFCERHFSFVVVRPSGVNHGQWYGPKIEEPDV